MRSLPSPFGPSARLVLIPLLLCSAIFKGAFGEAIVLHRHGAFRVHAHLVSSTGLLASVAGSPRYGHFALPNLSKSSPTTTHVLAIIYAGSPFVTNADDGDKDEQPIVQPHDMSFALLTLTQCPPSDDFSTHLPTFDHKSASAVQLLRNHTLLL